jgi:hypothetical protein
VRFAEPPPPADPPPGAADVDWAVWAAEGGAGEDEGEDEERQQPVGQAQRWEEEEAPPPSPPPPPPPAFDADAYAAALRSEEVGLRAERRAAGGQADAPSDQMYREVQELLQLFGLPFLIAPTEAEAQAAWLDAAGLVDGVVTDDNDAFLFGARRVYRNLFEDKKVRGAASGVGVGVRGAGAERGEASGEASGERGQRAAAFLFLSVRGEEEGAENSAVLASWWSWWRSSSFYTVCSAPSLTPRPAPPPTPDPAPPPAPPPAPCTQYVEEYRASDLEAELGLDRARLVCLALLLGSDYTPGVGGVGKVIAAEVMRAFPDGYAGLARFAGWMQAVDEEIVELATGVKRPSPAKHKGRVRGRGKGAAAAGRRKRAARAGAAAGKKRRGGGGAAGGQAEGGAAAADESADAEAGSETDEGSGSEAGGSEGEELDPEREFCATHRAGRRVWTLPPGFPSAEVVQAYENPRIDASKERFTFGRPDLELLRAFCRERFGWEPARCDELLLPVLRAHEERAQQQTLDTFFTAKQRFAKIRSKRLQKASGGRARGVVRCLALPCARLFIPPPLCPPRSMRRPSPASPAGTMTT